MFSFFVKGREDDLIFKPNAVMPSASVDSVLDTRYIFNGDIEVSLAVGKLKDNGSDVLAIQDFSVNPSDIATNILRFAMSSKGPFINFVVAHPKYAVSWQSFVALTNTKQFTPGRPVYIIQDPAAIKNILLIMLDSNCELSAPLADLLAVVSSPNLSPSIAKY